MPKKARRPTEKQLSRRSDYRPPPTETPQEIMLKLDAENMVRLLHEFTSCMPATFKEVLKLQGFLQFKVSDYEVLITTGKRFESNGGYCKVVS